MEGFLPNKFPNKNNYNNEKTSYKSHALFPCFIWTKLGT